MKPKVREVVIRVLLDDGDDEEWVEGTRSPPDLSAPATAVKC